MESIVLELQKEAMVSNNDVSGLLRRSLVIARKLELIDFEKWVNDELSGYRAIPNSAPDYREITGTLQWFNQVRGWCPVLAEDPELMDTITNVKLFESVSELENLVNSTDSNNFVYQLNQKQQNLISSLGDGGLQQFRLLFSKNQAQRIIETVKNIILDWTLTLEKDGVLGEGMTFSEQEKIEAIRQNYTVNNFYGNTSGLQIQQHTQQSTQSQVNEFDGEAVDGFIKTLKENINHIESLDRKSKKAVQKEIETIQKQIKSSKPNIPLVKESLTTIRNVLEGISGSLAAQGLLYQLSHLPIW